MPTATPAGKSASKSTEKPSAKATVKEAKVEKPAKAQPAAKPVKPVKAEKPVEKPVVTKAAPAPAAAAPVAPAAPTGPIDYDAFLAKLTPKDRLNIERHITAIEELSTKAHAKLWKRLATMMMGMASHSAKANGQQSMQFYIQDGKYRMQIFAIEDLRDGSIHAYTADAVDEALKAGVLLKAKPADEPDTLRLPGTDDVLMVERLDGKVSNPAPFYKDMLGWNRRAVHVTLPAMASDPQIEAVEKLLVLGAKKAGAIK